MTISASVNEATFASTATLLLDEVFFGRSTVEGGSVMVSLFFFLFGVFFDYHAPGFRSILKGDKSALLSVFKVALGTTTGSL